MMTVLELDMPRLRKAPDFVHFPRLLIRWCRILYMFSRILICRVRRSVFFLGGLWQRAYRLRLNIGLLWLNKNRHGRCGSCLSLSGCLRRYYALIRGRRPFRALFKERNVLFYAVLFQQNPIRVDFGNLPAINCVPDFHSFVLSFGIRHQSHFTFRC